MSEWISVEERLPTHDGYYLIAVTPIIGNDIGVFTALFVPDGTPMQWEILAKRGVSGVTHWMPLPDPPGAALATAYDAGTEGSCLPCP